MKTTTIGNESTLLQDDESSLFSELKSLCFPTYKYKQGNCHNIAHFCSQVLTQKGIKHKKIWSFAPARYVKYSRESINRPDPNQLAINGNLSWGYHVAIVIENGSNSLVYDYIIDESQPVTLMDWCKEMNVSKSKIEIVDAANYLFFSLRKKIPTTDFKYFHYEDNCKEDMWLEKGLAINETAYDFMNGERDILNENSFRAIDYRILVGNISNFECIFVDQGFNKIVTHEFQHRNTELIEKYRLIFATNLEKWIQKVAQKNSFKCVF